MSAPSGSFPAGDAWGGPSWCDGPALLTQSTGRRKAWLPSYCLLRAVAFSVQISLHVNCCSVAESCLTLCNPMNCGTSGLPCPLPSPWVCSNSCPLSQWCYPINSSSVVPFSSCLQSFPASGSFPVSQLFALVAKALELQLQHWSFQRIFRVDFLLRLTALISLQSKRLSRVFSSTTVQKHQSFSAQPSLWMEWS